MTTSRRQRRPVVVLYERIADAIHRGVWPPGSTLPSEPRLAAELGVSRPALREALLLLQEDGLLSVRRGVGRTVNDAPPRRGYEQLQPLEQLLGSGTPLRVRPVARAEEEPTDFSTQHLHAPAGTELRFWESVLVAEGVAAALSQEWAAPDGVLEAAHPAFARALREPAAPEGSMLAVLAAASREMALTAHSGVTATLLGQRRGDELGRAADTPAVLVTQVVRAGDVPVMAAKHMLPTGSPALPVLQSN
ncbi:MULTISPECIES: GntR family transcriptional regulator [Streptomyces]|uniref:GntR family transcriptional regulator n=1 Tax=Streptomyces tsukubensis (strain DSM 42081 / NBRC 108919 / NRRL 18488 / 9993) TaxID=1114943 RepID=I2N976_STRT9|nr:GntR family transcriptional regulator [Streptomyces tsukubensis]MYS63733.1 GntR family transcriptional regulator [Streptomyces sp. SID5473]AZK97426.1 GntR family transcriptional regulator [Streptomyces tsukubensis]EIF93573.1 GntR family transcriptional regulator [Streptomyces tsukubensis NRRL18488]QKM66620.1 GntR family transcriptional regulator [Streptomyces tsukubensis NRRL18488]TAI45035.1 GntR family transcriptional regulator [Streptomyces tsukubensis]